MTPDPVPAADAGFAASPQAHKLLDRMRIHLCTRHYSIRTEQAYVDWVGRWILFHDKCHPQERGAAEGRCFSAI